MAKTRDMQVGILLRQGLVREQFLLLYKISRDYYIL